MNLKKYLEAHYGIVVALEKFLRHSEATHFFHKSLFFHWIFGVLMSQKQQKEEKTQKMSIRSRFR